MLTAVSDRGQPVIPIAIRRRYSIAKGDQLMWLDDGVVIRVIPRPADPLKALRGAGRGEGLQQRLRELRQSERAHGR